MAGMTESRVQEAIRHGLTQGDAEDRLRREGWNELPGSKNRPLLGLIRDILSEPMILLLVVTGGIYLILGDREEALFLLGSIGLIIGIQLHQERKTERALEALRDLSSPRARVVRDGETRRIPGREVVRDDILLISEGERVPADAVVLSSTNLSLDESLLTGESVPVQKTVWSEGPTSGPPGGDVSPFVYSGTMVVRGNGILRATATGVRSQLGKIGQAIASQAPEKTRLEAETSRLVRLSAVAGILLCVAVALVYGSTRHAWLEAVLAGLALAIALMPEEFPVILTVFMALGAWRIARNRVLTRRSPAIEMLGAATVLCVDKTGTLTKNQMVVRRLIAGGAVCEVDPEGTVPEPFHRTLEVAVLASQRTPIDPMDRAIRELGDQALRDTERLHRDWSFIREYPLTPDLLAITRAWRPDAQADFFIAAKGAPEAIVDLCRLDAGAAQVVLQDVRACAEEGYRILGVAAARSANPELPSTPREFAFEFVGLLAFEDPIRITVPDALRECTAAGIRTVMMTGDHPGTARSVARKLGLPHAEDVVPGRDFERWTDDEVRSRVKDVNVFARVVPEQKLRIVRALRDNGEVVAMTGDGVNDAPALKAAHIGIAMGSRGTDVAREAAALVLLDDDFASIVQAVRLGRRIYDNIRKAMAFVIAVHVPIAGVAFVPVLLGWPLVLLPAHIVFIEFIIDPICSIAFEAEREERDVMTRRPRPIREPLFSWKTWMISLVQGFGVLGIVLGALVLGRAHGNGEAETRALAFTMLVVGNLVMVLSNRSWTRSLFVTLREPNPAMLVMAAAALGVLALTLSVPFLARLFRFEALSGYDLAVVGVGAVVAVVWCELLKHVRNRI